MVTILQSRFLKKDTYETFEEALSDYFLSQGKILLEEVAEDHLPLEVKNDFENAKNATE